KDTSFDVIKKRREKYQYYKNKFDIALALYDWEINNSNFINSFNTLVMPFLNEIGKCEEALR
ncbi:516_t:CDS:1, partial [Racocetra fulgida]